MASQQLCNLWQGWWYNYCGVMQHIVRFNRFAHSAGPGIVEHREVYKFLLLERTLSPRWPQDGAKRPQDGPKMAPTWAQDGPKIAPRWPQDGPRWLLEGPKKAPRSLKWPQEAR